VQSAGTNALSSEAIQVLVDGHRRFLSFVEQRVGSRALAEDILQSAFVRSLERGSEIRDEESVIAWFYRVLRNAVVDHYRHRAATERALQGWASEVATHEQPEADTEREICGCIAALLMSLKAEYREALEIVDLNERSLNELAERSGITPGNAAVRVHRAREALRKQVIKACGTCAEHGCLNCQCKSGMGGHNCASDESSGR
jgi:RNA polymerase sigma-70 factor (ECF subfamily)